MINEQQLFLRLNVFVSFLWLFGLFAITNNILISNSVMATISVIFVLIYLYTYTLSKWLIRFDEILFKRTFQLENIKKYEKLNNKYLIGVAAFLVLFYLINLSCNLTVEKLFIFEYIILLLYFYHKNKFLYFFNPFYFFFNINIYRFETYSNDYILLTNTNFINKNKKNILLNKLSNDILLLINNKNNKN